MQHLIQQLNDQSVNDTNNSSFSELYDKYAPALYGRIITVVKEKEFAEKILAKIFINAYVEKNIPVNQNLSYFTSVLNHSRIKSYSILRAMKIFSECNCSLQKA